LTNNTPLSGSIFIDSNSKDLYFKISKYKNYLKNKTLKTSKILNIYRSINDLYRYRAGILPKINISNIIFNIKFDKTMGGAFDFSYLFHGESVDYSIYLKSMNYEYTYSNNQYYLYKNKDNNLEILLPNSFPMYNGFIVLNLNSLSNSNYTVSGYSSYNADIPAFYKHNFYLTITNNTSN
jgi:hypothetical protein